MRQWPMVWSCALAVLLGTISIATIRAADDVLVTGPLDVKITYSDKTRGIVSKTELAELYELRYESIKYRMVKDPKSSLFTFAEQAGKGIEKIEAVNQKQAWVYDTTLKQFTGKKMPPPIPTVIEPLPSTWAQERRYLFFALENNYLSLERALRSRHNEQIDVLLKRAAERADHLQSKNRNDPLVANYRSLATFAKDYQTTDKELSDRIAKINEELKRLEQNDSVLRARAQAGQMMGLLNIFAGAMSSSPEIVEYRGELFAVENPNSGRAIQQGVSQIASSAAEYQVERSKINFAKSALSGEIVTRYEETASKLRGLRTKLSDAIRKTGPIRVKTARTQHHGRDR